MGKIDEKKNDIPKDTGQDSEAMVLFYFLGYRSNGPLYTIKIWIFSFDIHK